MREQHTGAITSIQEQGLTYPVTLVDGMLLNAGTVSYPSVLHAVETQLTGSRSS